MGRTLRIRTLAFGGWSYQPNIGENGQVDFSKGPNWKKVSDDGWELKGVKANSNTYIFEKCE
jgi:hypothetical protein